MNATEAVKVLREALNNIDDYLGIHHLTKLINNALAATESIEQDEPVNCDLRLDAYYYGFDQTGVPAIDLILSAVACAGKAFHHTEDWREDAGMCYGSLTGNTPESWIQNAANDAAELYFSSPQPDALAPRLDNSQIRKIMHKYSKFMGSDTYSDTEFDCLQDVIAFAKAVIEAAAPSTDKP